VITPDGIIAAADREAQLHPKSDAGKPITAWERRGKTLYNTVVEVNNLRHELEEMKQVLKSRPF
jgi:hypothetical protein